MPIATGPLLSPVRSSRSGDDRLARDSPGWAHPRPGRRQEVPRAELAPSSVTPRRTSGRRRAERRCPRGEDGEGLAAHNAVAHDPAERLREGLGGVRRGRGSQRRAGVPPPRSSRPGAGGAGNEDRLGTEHAGPQEPDVSERGGPERRATTRPRGTSAGLPPSAAASPGGDCDLPRLKGEDQSHLGRADHCGQRPWQPDDRRSESLGRRTRSPRVRRVGFAQVSGQVPEFLVFSARDGRIRRPQRPRGGHSGGRSDRPGSVPRRSRLLRPDPGPPPVHGDGRPEYLHDAKRPGA
jgi:hypothetical protein